MFWICPDIGSSVRHGKRVRKAQKFRKNHFILKSAAKSNNLLLFYFRLCVIAFIEFPYIFGSSFECLRDIDDHFSDKFGLIGLECGLAFVQQVNHQLFQSLHHKIIAFIWSAVSCSTSNSSKYPGTYYKTFSAGSPYSRKRCLRRGLEMDL